ncbi:MAG: MFS transporter [Eubacteriaceae bacterium]|nr:MFS transporter [Eubacteriaceae bacterium]
MEAQKKNGLGFTPDQMKKFTKNAWVVLLGFSILYCFLYCGRLNLSYTMPAMLKETSWDTGDLGILSAILFWTYGMGHLFNGRLGEIFGVNKFIFVGAILSAAANILIGFQTSLVMLCVLWGLNGYFQSMLWSPGMSLLSQWWPANKRGFATGFANAFSGFGQAAAAVAVTIAFIILPGWGWKAGFILPVIPLIIIAIIYIFVVKDKPKKVGLPDYKEEDSERAADEDEKRKLLEEKGKLYPYIHLFKMWRFDLWLIIIAGSSIARYGLLTWIPTYYTENFGLDVKEGAMGTIYLPLGMALGTFIIPWLTDKFCPNNRLPAVIICAAVAGATVFGFMGIGPGVASSLLLFFAGFFIYAINGIVWAYATDVGGRVFSGTAAGILDAFAYIGASVQAIFFGFALKGGNWTLVFSCIIGVCVIIVIAAIIAGSGLNKNKAKR